MSDKKDILKEWNGESWVEPDEYLSTVYFFIPRKWWSAKDWWLAITLRFNGKTFIQVRFR